VLGGASALSERDSLAVGVAEVTYGRSERLRAARTAGAVSRLVAWEGQAAVAALAAG